MRTIKVKDPLNGATLGQLEIDGERGDPLPAEPLDFEFTDAANDRSPQTVKVIRRGRIFEVDHGQGPYPPLPKIVRPYTTRNTAVLEPIPETPSEGEGPSESD